MFEFQKCKKIGMCNNCGIRHDDEHPVYEFKISSDGTRWNVVMLCPDCLREVISEANALLNNTKEYGWFIVDIGEEFSTLKCRKCGGIVPIKNNVKAYKYCPHCGSDRY